PPRKQRDGKKSHAKAQSREGTGSTLVAEIEFFAPSRLRVSPFRPSSRLSFFLCVPCGSNPSVFRPNFLRIQKQKFLSGARRLSLRTPNSELRTRSNREGHPPMLRGTSANVEGVPS